MISRGKYLIGYKRLMSSTGSVILGGFINAAKMASTASGRDARDHRVVFLGGGSAAVGYVLS
jgi:malate dehydrogenase (oxaloacetate-decarboxylating)(NADP+)